MIRGGLLTTKEQRVESDRAHVSMIMFSWESIMRRLRPNQRANNNAAFSSNLGTVSSFNGTNLVFVPNKKTHNHHWERQPNAHKLLQRTPFGTHHKTLITDTGRFGTR